MKLKKKLKKITGFSLILLGLFLIFLPFSLVPLINSERVWRLKSFCMVEPWLCKPPVANVPRNDLIQNKYDLTVFNWYGFNGSGSISFKHQVNNTLYTFAFNFTVEDFSKTTTFRMIPGKYKVTFGTIQFYCELWEHGIIPQYGDAYFFLGFDIIAVAVLFLAIRYLGIWRILIGRF